MQYLCVTQATVLPDGAAGSCSPASASLQLPLALVAGLVPWDHCRCTVSCFSRPLLGWGRKGCLRWVFHWGNVCDECQPCCGVGMGRGVPATRGGWGQLVSRGVAQSGLAPPSGWAVLETCALVLEKRGWSSFCNIFSSFLFLLLSGAQSTGVEEAWSCQPGFVVLESPSLRRATYEGVGSCTF